MPLPRLAHLATLAALLCAPAPARAEASAAAPEVPDAPTAREVPDAATAPEAPEPPPAPDDEAEAGRLEPKGRFLAGIESEESERFGRRYGIRQARIGLAYREGPVRAEVEGDLAEAKVLNDAWLEYRPGSWARARLGRFKTPFSEFRLTSAWDLPVLRRDGLQRRAEDAGFGGRNTGAAARVELDDLWRLDLHAGVFEGLTVGTEPASEDGYARVEFSPGGWKPLQLGASLARKAVFDGGAGDGLGVDARLRLGRLTALVEALEVENAVSGATVSGVQGFLAWRQPLSATVWLEPAVAAERSRRDGVSGTALAATVGTGFRDRFLVRAGIEHGPVAPAAPESTAVLVLAGVQL